MTLHYSNELSLKVCNTVQICFKDWLFNLCPFHRSLWYSDDMRLKKLTSQYSLMFLIYFFEFTLQAIIDIHC